MSKLPIVELQLSTIDYQFTHV